MSQSTILRCPVPSPDGLPCQKRIPDGLTAEDGHAGGHMWASDQTWAKLDGGHYDARTLLDGEPVTVHELEDCPGWPECFAPDAPRANRRATATGDDR